MSLRTVGFTPMCPRNTCDEAEIGADGHCYVTGRRRLWRHNRKELHMYARFTTIQGKPEKIEDAIRVVENDVIPASKVLPGFKNGYWYADRKSGKLLSLT